MRMKIVATTNGQFLGHEFESEIEPIKLAEDVEFFVDKTLELTEGIRFISSNFIIDAIEV